MPPGEVTYDSEPPYTFAQLLAEVFSRDVEDIRGDAAGPEEERKEEEGDAGGKRRSHNCITCKVDLKQHLPNLRDRRASGRCKKHMNSLFFTCSLRAQLLRLYRIK